MWLWTVKKKKNTDGIQSNISHWLRACDPKLMTSLPNICYLRSHMLKDKGRKQPTHSERSTLTYTVHAVRLVVFATWKTLLLIIFTPPTFALLKTAGHALPV